MRRLASSTRFRSSLVTRIPSSLGLCVALETAAARSLMIQATRYLLQNSSDAKSLSASILTIGLIRSAAGESGFESSCRGRSKHMDTVKFSEKEIRFSKLHACWPSSHYGWRSYPFSPYMSRFRWKPFLTWPRTQKPVRLEIFARTIKRPCLLINTPRTGCVM